MTGTTFFPESESSYYEEDILSVFQPKTADKKEIKQGMAPQEIAEVVSEHLISIVRKDLNKVSKIKNG